MVFSFFILGLLLSACAPTPAPQPTPDINAALTQVVATLMAGGTQTAQILPASPTNDEVHLIVHHTFKSEIQTQLHYISSYEPYKENMINVRILYFK